MAIFNSKKTAFARERLTVTSGAVVALTASVYNDTSNSDRTPNQLGNAKRHATGARVCVESGTGDAHFSEDGTAPTAGVAVSDVGTIIGARDLVVLEAYEAICKFKMIALAANAIIEVVYYR